jgi:type I restriction enzyme R subunit
MLNEADTCRIYVLPKIYAAGWKDDQIREQYYFTDGRDIVVGRLHSRSERKKADYLLRYRPDFPIAVIEAESESKSVGAGMQQAMEYAEILGIKFAYSTNGHGIIEHDYFTGEQRELVLAMLAAAAPRPVGGVRLRKSFAHRAFPRALSYPETGQRANANDL